MGTLGDDEGGRLDTGVPRHASRREAHAAALEGYEHGPDATQRATESALERVHSARSIVLVEGVSDQIAVETLAERMDRSFDDEKVVVVPIGGAHAAKLFVPRFAHRAGVKLSGLVDRGEATHFERALVDVGLIDRSGDPGALHHHGFFVCDADLEDELIRSVDQHDLEALLASEGDLGAFRSLQNQPVWRARSFHAQMHRWLRSVALRRSRYAQLLVLEASWERIPRPLLNLVQHI